MPLRCPSCRSDQTIVLVHSLRLLCGACMHQWTPEALDPMPADTAESASTISRLLEEIDRGR